MQFLILPHKQVIRITQKIRAKIYQEELGTLNAMVSYDGIKWWTCNILWHDQEQSLK